MRSLRFSARLAPALLPLALLTACGSSLKLRVLTAPRDATLEVRTFQANKELASYRFEDGKSEISVGEKVDRIGLRATSYGHQEAERSLTPAEVAELPLEKDHHELTLPLVREFQEITQLVVDYDPGRKAFVGRPRRVRAYDDVTDDNGRSAARVFDGLPEGHGIRGMAISPDGRRLVFAEAKPFEPSALAEAGARDIVELESCTLYAIQLVDENGRRQPSGKTRLRGGDFTDVDPFFTPDGEAIRFSSNRRRRESADIVEISSTSREGGLKYIYSDSRDHTALRPTIGPDGIMVYSLYPPTRGRATEASAKIWSVGGEGGAYETEIIDGVQPAISPDGASIAYVGQDGNLYKVDVNGTNETQLTFEADAIRARYRASLRDPDSFDPRLFQPYSTPCWSPNGKHILYASYEGGDSAGRPNENIFTMTAEGRGTEQLTSNRSADTHPLIDPRGRAIYFLSNRGGRWAIWSLEADPRFSE